MTWIVKTIIKHYSLHTHEYVFSSYSYKNQRIREYICEKCSAKLYITPSYKSLIVRASLKTCDELIMEKVLQ